MSAQEDIRELDADLARDGEDVTLRRVTGASPNQANNDVLCRANVFAVTTERIIGGIAQTELNVILSPTQINAAQWPGGVATQTEVPGSPKYTDPRVPKINADKMYARGTLRNVTFVDPLFVDGELVRINLRIG